MTEIKDYTSKSNLNNDLTAKTSLLNETEIQQDSIAFNQQYADAIISNPKINDLAVDKLITGTITSKKITLAITDGEGDTYIATGKTDFTNTDSGFILGMDDSDSNKAKFYIGDATTYLNWDASSLTIVGSITATTGAIGGWTIGATSITDTAGTVGMSSAVTAGDDIRFWAGHTTPASAPFKVTEAGALTASSATVQGTVNATGGYIGASTALITESTGLNTGITGHIRGGQTGYNVGTGFFLGYDTDNYKFSIGNPSADYITWDGSALTISSQLNVDIWFTAGEALTAGDAVGQYGEVTETTTNCLANQATYVDQDNPTTNYDGAGFIMTEVDSTLTHQQRALISFAGMPAIPTTPTGLVMVKIEIKMYAFREADSLQSIYPTAYRNNATFDETTVTWNTKPAVTLTTFGIAESVSGGGYKDSGWAEVTEEEYNAVRTNGVTLVDETVGNGDQGHYSDEDDANQQPKIDVRFTYKIQNGKIWKVKATTAEYANSIMGIALATVAADETVKVRTEGKVTGLTGLTAYSTYYLSDTDGAIATSAGSNSKIIGRALSTTALQVKYSIT